MESSLGVLSPTSDIRVVEHEQVPKLNNSGTNAFVIVADFLVNMSNGIFSNFLYLSLPTKMKLASPRPLRSER